MDTTSDKDGSVLDTWRNAPVVSNSGSTPSSIITKSPIIYTMPSSGYTKQLSAPSISTMQSPMITMPSSTSTMPSSTSTMPSSMYTMPSTMYTMPSSMYTMPSSMYTKPSDIHTSLLSHNLPMKPYSISAESRTPPTEPYTSPTVSRTFPTEPYTSSTGYRTLPTEPYTSPTGSRTLSTEPYILPLESRTLYKPPSVMTSQEEEPLSSVQSQTTNAMNLSADKTEVKPPSKPSFSTLHRRRLSAQYRYTGTPLIKYTGGVPTKNIGAIPRPVPISRPAPIVLPQLSAIGNPMLSPYHNIAAMTQPIFNPNADENMMSYLMNQMIYQQYYNNGQVFSPSLQSQPPQPQQPQQPQQQQTTDGGMVHEQGQHMFPPPGLPQQQQQQQQQQYQFYSGAGLPMSVPSPFGYAAAETPRWQNNAVNSNMIAPPPPPPPLPLLLPFSSLPPSLLQQQQQQQQQQQSASVPKITATAVRNDDYINESYMDSCTGGGVTSRTLLPLNTSETPLPPKYSYRHREKYWSRSPPPPYVAGKRRNNSDWPPRSPPPPYAEWDSERVSSSSPLPSRHYYPDSKKARRYSPTTPPS